MGMALGRLAQEDPTFKVHTDPDSGQTIISGMGELHLEIIVDRMMREYKVEANVGKRRWRIARPFAGTPRRKANTFARPRPGAVRSRQDQAGSATRRDGLRVR